MPATSPGLAEFLRARRARLAPETVGIATTARRRVPGLRRDELALLAGISTQYYTRLEQGHDQHPSAQVVDALARALQLSDDEGAHLHELVRARPRRPRRRPERVSESVRGLLDAWTTTPAYVQGRCFDVLAANPLATALTPMFTPGRNILREVFLTAAVRDQFADWEARLPGLVAALRALAGPDVEDPALVDLVGELSVRSERFRTLWSRHDVQPQVGGGVHRIDHPQVGRLDLQHDKFHASDAPGQMLVVYHAVPGTETAQRLALLAALAADPPVRR